MRHPAIDMVWLLPRPISKRASTSALPVTVVVTTRGSASLIMARTSSSSCAGAAWSTGLGWPV